MAAPSFPHRPRPWASRSAVRQALALCGLLGLSRVANAVEPAVSAQAGEHAVSSPLRQALVDDYCEHVSNAAASESALLWSPRLFSRFGTIRGTADAGTADALERELRLNLQAGVDVRPMLMHAGALVEARARAECRRYAAELSFQHLLSDLALDPRPALTAKVTALRAALPRAEELQEQSEQALSASQITLQEHTLTRARVDALRQATIEAEFELASVSPRTNAGVPARLASRVFEDLRLSEARRQEVEGQLRRVEGFGVSIRGGYDEVFGVPQSLPIFGAVTVDFVPGGLWQPAREREGVQARQRWVEHRIQEAQERLRSASERVKQQLEVSERQIAQLELRVTELEARSTELARVGTPAAEEFRRDIWFELVKRQADLASARARVETLVRQRRELEQGQR